MAKTIISYLNGFSFATITWLFIETKVKLKVPKLVCFKTATIIEVHLKCLYDFYSHYLCIISMLKNFCTQLRTLILWLNIFTLVSGLYMFINIFKKTHREALKNCSGISHTKFLSFSQSMDDVI